MKLIGSLTEQQFRDELVKSKKYIFTENSTLLQVLRHHFPHMKTAYILFWIPEDGADILTVLVNCDTVTQIELERDEPDTEPAVEIHSVSDYQKWLRKMGEIKLAVAIDLAQRDMA